MGAAAAGTGGDPEARAWGGATGGGPVWRQSRDRPGDKRRRLPRRVPSPFASSLPCPSRSPLLFVRARWGRGRRAGWVGGGAREGEKAQAGGLGAHRRPGEPRCEEEEEEEPEAGGEGGEGEGEGDAAGARWKAAGRSVAGGWRQLHPGMVHARWRRAAADSSCPCARLRVG